MSAVGLERKKRKTCKTCMWWWDLHDTGEKKCYRQASRFFHKPTKNGCPEHEDHPCYRWGKNISAVQMED